MRSKRPFINENRLIAILFFAELLWILLTKHSVGTFIVSMVLMRFIYRIGKLWMENIRSKVIFDEDIHEIGYEYGYVYPGVPVRLIKNTKPKRVPKPKRSFMLGDTIMDVRNKRRGFIGKRKNSSADNKRGEYNTTTARNKLGYNNLFSCRLVLTETTRNDLVNWVRPID